MIVPFVFTVAVDHSAELLENLALRVLVQEVV